MNCHRCADSMILKKLCDYGGYYWGWKCIRCGEIIDQMVLQNQPIEKVPQLEKSQMKGASTVR